MLVARRSSGPASHASGWVGPARPVLRLGSTVVAQYEEGASVDSVLSPRPFLDNVVSRAGTPLSVTEPTDHPHHLGVSLAIPDVNGTSYWGGRTYVRGEGSIMVPNHGRQRRDRPAASTVTRSHERLSWVDHTGTTQLVEVRELRSAELANGWALRWRSHLKATLDAITFGSPATNGRDGAGYGGIFWRFAPEIARVFSPAGDTERDVHGAATPWLAFTFPERGTTVVLVQGDDAAAVVRPLRGVPRRRSRRSRGTSRTRSPRAASSTSSSRRSSSTRSSPTPPPSERALPGAARARPAL